MNFQKIRKDLKKNLIVRGLYYLPKIVISSIFDLFPTHDKELKKYRNLHLGQACFIVATGPSLNSFDLDLLDKYNMKCFSVNSIVNSFEFTSWRPDYYVISDPVPYKAVSSKLNSSCCKTFFFRKGISKKEVKHISFFSRTTKRSIAELKQQFINLGPSENLDKYFVDSTSCVFACIQLAIYMGFKKIYLLGQDCNYGLGNEHSKIANITYKASFSTIDGTKIIDVYKSYSEYAKKNNIQIVNCTRGGQLEVFPRMQLERVLEEQ